MAVSHIFSSPVANITGTVTVFDTLGSTKTEAASNIVQPQHWNSVHNQFLTISGNTAGQSTLSGTNIVFAGGPNVTLSANAGTVSISADAGGAGDGGNILVAGTRTAGSNSSVLFSNLNGVSFGLDAVGGSVMTASHNGLTTARASNDGVGLNTALTANGVAWTVNSSGVSLNVPAFLTTAMLSNAVTLSNIRISAGSTSNLASAFTFSNSNGVSFGLNAGTITAAHNGLTTARASNDGVGLNTAQTNVTWTVNSAGISLNAGGYLTTAALSNHSHGNPTLALTNLSGTTGSNSAGLTLSLSAAAPGGGGAINVSAGTTSGNLQTLQFNNGGGVSFGLNGSTITATVNAGGGGGTATMWWPYNEGVNVAGQQGQGTLNIVPLPTPAPAAGGEVHADRVVFPLYFTNASNSSGSATVSLWMGLYTKNASTISLVHSTSVSASVGFAGNNSSTNQRGIRLLTVPWTTTIGDGRYYVAVASRTTSGGANATISQMLVSQLNSNVSGLWDEASNVSIQWPLGMGVYSATTSGIPGSIAFSQIRGSASLAARPPSWFMVSGTA